MTPGALAIVKIAAAFVVGAPVAAAAVVAVAAAVAAAAAVFVAEANVAEFGVAALIADFVSNVPAASDAAAAAEH